ncbi:trypsin-like peptidase domain-containing protein [Paractinoplanes rhizophilus]|uniref:Trypsin-like peptidase domain-containing protein n=1 Tax=Paractinoplanes rhizophilus TaxID=1416877 RepID=A0ABW2I3P7_9ACTN
MTGPVSDPWTLAVHGRERDGERGFEPFGTAVAISPRRALTCAHVVAGRSEVWVSFPRVTTLWKVRQQVERVEYDPDEPGIADVAVLHFAEDLPAAVEPARLRAPEPEALLGLRWWAFGFPASSLPHGNEAQGVVGARLAHGWVRLDTDSPYPVEQGFSGGGLWVPDYGVVGIVGRARITGDRRGDAQALTIAQADVFLPGEKLRVLVDWTAADAGPVAMSSWGWELATDREAGRHWVPRGRGVTTEAERGYRFRGRAAALREIVAWLERKTPDRRVLVVTGSPGVGKSAVLGRIVTTADAKLRARLPAGDVAVRASLGSVACAVHAKGKTALEVAKEIATAASIPLPQEPEEVAVAVREQLSAGNKRFNVVIDALDEADTAEEARLILSKVVLPLVQTCAEKGVQVVLGTRRNDSRGSLLAGLAGETKVIDLDEGRYSELDDLRAYASATLRLIGDERPGNPYEDEAVADPVARRIAELAEGNFLVAGLEARRRGMYDTTAAGPASVTLTPSVDAALDAFVARLAPVGGMPAREVLTALAYAEAPGWTTALWKAAAEALGGRIAEPALDRFARSAAANFLVETSQEGHESVFRLFHQALNDALLRPRGPGGARADERALVGAFLELGHEHGWSAAPPYLLRSLAGHAGRAGLIDDLLADDDFLLHADLLRLIPAAAEATRERERAHLLRLTPQAVAAPAPERAALLNVVQALQLLPPAIAHPAMPYRARWAHTAPRVEHAALEGHTDWVNSVCAVKGLLASAGDDATIRLWNPLTGHEQAVLTGHAGPVNSVCAVRGMLASGGNDGTVRLWNPATGRQQKLLRAHTGPVTAVCAVKGLLASAGGNTVRIWDPGTGHEIAVLTGHTDWVKAICAVKLRGRELVVTASKDLTVRLWDPETGAQETILEEDAAWMTTLRSVTVDGRSLLAASTIDGTVRLWDPASGQEQAVLRGHTGPVNAICAIRGRLATASNDTTVRIWDPHTGRQEAILEGHADWVSSVCAVDGMLASAGGDRIVRLWDPATGHRHAAAEAHGEQVRAVCPAGTGLLASAGEDGIVRLSHLADGAARHELRGHHAGGVNALGTVPVRGQARLASAGDDGTVRLWEPSSGRPLIVLRGHTDRVRAVAAVVTNGRVLLASGGDDQTVRLWDPATGHQQAVLKGHNGTVNAVTAIGVAGRVMIASGGDDRTVRLWDLAPGRRPRVLAGHAGPVTAVRAINGLLATAGDETVRLWNPESGLLEAVLEGHTGPVTSLAAVDGMLASAGADGTVRLWDTRTARATTIPIHFPVSSCAAVGGGLAVGGTAGLLVLEIAPA